MKIGYYKLERQCNLVRLIKNTEFGDYVVKLLKNLVTTVINNSPNEDFRTLLQ